jgi:hypothetical protein
MRSLDAVFLLRMFEMQTPPRRRQKGLFCSIGHAINKRFPGADRHRDVPLCHLFNFARMNSRKPPHPAWSLAAVFLAVFALHADAPFEKFNSSVPLDGEVFILVSVNSGRCLSVSDASEYSGANVVQGPTAVDAGNAERWRVSRCGDDYYKLINEKSGKVLAVPQASREFGTQIIQWDDAGIEDQRWKFVKEGNHYALQSKVSSLMLDVMDGSTESGAPVIQWPWKTTENANQIWFVQWVPGLGR